MPVDKVVNLAPVTDIMEMMSEEEPDIEIILEDDGSAVIEVNEEDDVEFYSNLAEVIDETELSDISSDLLALFDADKASRQDWEQMYAKGMDLLGLKIEDRTRPFRGAAGAVHPMLTEAVIQFQSQAFKELMPAGGPVRTETLGKETTGFARAGLYELPNHVGDERIHAGVRSITILRWIRRLRIQEGLL